MVTADVIPETDILTQWYVVPAGTHESAIDEDKGSPNTGDYIRCGIGDNNLTDSFHMDDTIQDCDEYTQVKAYIYYNNIESPLGTPRQINIYVNGAWQAPQNIPPQAIAWRNFTWAGLSGNQASLDDLRVKVVTGTMADDKFIPDEIRIYTMYAEVTYSVVVVGYAHKFLGIPSAKIGKVCGIPTANIANIKGV